MQTEAKDPGEGAVGNHQIGKDIMATVIMAEKIIVIMVEKIIVIMVEKIIVIMVDKIIVIMVEKITVEI